MEDQKFGFPTQSDLAGRYNDIDVPKLFDELNMKRKPNNIGYKEQHFNTCHIESNRSPRPLCKDMYLGVLHFQMLCRKNDGAATRENLLPIQSNEIRWKRGTFRGWTKTDNEGYGKVHFITDISSRFRPIYMYMGSKVLYKRLKDYWKMVLPKNWCSRR